MCQALLTPNVRSYISEEWMAVGWGRSEGEWKEGREEELWVVCKMNKNFKIKNINIFDEMILFFLQ